MSNPETDALREAIDNGAATEAEMTSLAGKLERERDKAQALVAEMKQAIVWAKAEAKERLHRLDQAACERRTWLEAHEKMKRERDEARRGIRLMAQNAEVWKERADQARRELDIQLESIHFHMERVPVREHPFRADDAKLWGEEAQ